MITRSAAETKKVGEGIAKKIKNGGVICLYGDLGAGKTTLVQGIAKGLGVKKKVISPTFIIVRRYEIRVVGSPSTPLRINEIKDRKQETGRKKRFLWHIDLYRLGNAGEIRDLGLEELWQESGNITLIEWPEKLGNRLPRQRIEIKLKTIGENEREIVVEKLT